MIHEQRMKSFNSRLSTPPTSKSESNVIIPQMLDNNGVNSNKRPNHNNIHLDEQSSTKERTQEDFDDTIE